ncbi:MAG: hypothetical protein ACKV2U_26730 [Bryobacteraceae bacterium]
MDESTLACWTAVVSESSAVSIDKLGKLIDYSNPPEFFEFACRQWERRDVDESGWHLLVESQIVLRAVSHPTALPLSEALTLARYAMEGDALFDTKLLRRLLALSKWPEDVPSNEVMRTLEILETFDQPHRLAMPLLKFSKFPDGRIQSKVAKILGRCVDSLVVMNELFQNPDGRVRANLLEGICRRESFELFLPLLDRATRDQHTRVSSIALAIRARGGHGGAGALIKMRANSKMNDIRKSAEFAQRIASGETSESAAVAKIPEAETASAPDVDPLSVVDPEPAVAAPVEEVHSQA